MFESCLTKIDKQRYKNVSVININGVKLKYSNFCI